MERCDFASVTAIIRSYISEAHEMSQIDFIYYLFASYLSSKAGEEFDLDNGLVCRWMNGLAKVSPKITAYYLNAGHQQELEQNLSKHILPRMFDSAMAEQKVYELVLRDVSISERKKQQFKHWVTSEVLPAIRKHGAYMTEPLLNQVVENPEVILVICLQDEDGGDETSGRTYRFNFPTSCREVGNGG